MTLFKQVALAVSLIIIIMLGSVMYINYNLAKQNMVESLYETTVNNISALSNKLSDAGEDKAHIVTIIDSEFDGGYYKSIEYKLNNKDFTYKQVDNDPVEGVPSWFIQNTDIKLDGITNDISSGWDIVGEVKVFGDTGIIYKTLYKMFVKLFYVFIVFVIISLLVLWILLHFVLKPLKDIQVQAEAIIKNKFVIQKKEPYTTEFQEVVKAMNAMVQKVEEIFNKANESAKRNQELLYNDPVTKLYNRRYMMLKLSDLIQLENKVNGGTSLFISLSSVEFINKTLGQYHSHQFLKEFAEVLDVKTTSCPEKVIARMNETEFAVILPSFEIDDVLIIIEEINEIFHNLLQENDILNDDLSISFGLYHYFSYTKKEELLTKTDSALLNAVAKEDGNVCFYKDEDNKDALGKAQWHSIIATALTDNGFRPKFWSVVDSSNGKTDHKVMTFTIKTKESQEYYFGDFIAPAINFGLVGTIFVTVIESFLHSHYKELNNQLCSIRLSNEFLKDIDSLSKLSELFERYANTLNVKLCFEISNSFAIKHTKLVKNYIKLFHKYGFEFGINSFIAESDDFSYLKELNPLFIKADSMFLHDQSKESMDSFHVLADSLGITIIATFVTKKDEIKELNENNILIIQGPATDYL